MSDRPVIDKKQLPPGEEEALERSGVTQGLNGTNTVEPVPIFNRAEGEVVYANQNNSWIVLGRDRPSVKASGVGGQAGTQSGMIDLVVGRMSSVKGGPKSNIWVSPNMKSDAARIYISQRTDIDDNFDLVDGSVGNSKGKSGIGIKADAVRIIGREGIKLVTQTDRKNSQGAAVNRPYGIDLIAGNDDSQQAIGKPFGLPGFGKKVHFLQPLVKGDNLTDALDEIVTQIMDLSIRLDNFAKAQSAYNRAIAFHTHPVVAAAFATPDLAIILPAYIESGIKQFVNCSMLAWPQQKNASGFKTNYLTPKGGRYICSRANRTT
jgi:hypothetical protein